MNIHLCTDVIKKYFLLIIPIHMSDYQVTMYSDNFKDFYLRVKRGNSYGNVADTKFQGKPLHRGR